MRTHIGQFMKGQDSGELNASKMMAPFITIEQYGRPGWVDAHDLDLDADRRMAKRGVELVFTGRYEPRELIAEADLVTEMTPVKHYYDRGVPARDGIER